LIKTFSRVLPEKKRARAGKIEKSPNPREINEFSFQGILQPSTAQRTLSSPGSFLYPARQLRQKVQDGRFVNSLTPTPRFA